jgi:hypothetical protein
VTTHDAYRATLSLYALALTLMQADLIQPRPAGLDVLTAEARAQGKALAISLDAERARRRFIARHR